MGNTFEHEFDWPGKPVLVTGAGGFIGSHLVEQLVERGARVRAFIRYNARGSQGWLEDIPAESRQSVEVFAGDISEYHSVRRSMEGIEIVFHLAALIGIPYSYASPAAYVRTNVVGSLNMLQAAQDAGIAKFIHTSTSEVYGTAQHVPIDEAHPLQAQSPYAATKIGADALAYSFHCAFDLPVAIIRPFNTYGPRQSLRAVIPTIICQLLDNATVRMGAMHPTRDFTHVSDTVSGFLAVAGSPATVGEVVNIGCGMEVSIQDLVRLIAELIGSEAAIEVEDKRMRPSASEVERLCAGTTKAQDLLGWKPTFHLRQGLAQTIEWFREHRSAYASKADEYQV